MPTTKEQLQSKPEYTEFWNSLPTTGPIRFRRVDIPPFNLVSSIATSEEQEGHNILLNHGGLVVPGEWSTVTAVATSTVAIVQDKVNADIWVEDQFTGYGFNQKNLPKLRQIFGNPVRVTLIGASPHQDRNLELKARDIKVRRKDHVKTLQKQLSELGLQAEIIPYWNPVRNSWLDAQIWASPDHYVEVRMSI